ncbi:MAG TPA: FAD-dependent monooxygenase [Phycisphaerae bacterium]|nr:FAD-dependent monooxygenase [Phycisphaerae bacterium]
MALRIVILGAGIGGLSAAIALRNAGFAPVLFEQAPELREAGAGVGIWSNAMASLEQLGVAEVLRNASLPLRRLSGANAAGNSISDIHLDSLGAEFAAAACHIVLRPTLLAALASHVPAETIHTGSRAVRVESCADHAVLHLADGRRETADLLVAADGLHSVARPCVVPPPDPIRYSGQTCFRGIACFPPPDPDTLREIQGAGIRGSVCPVAADTVYWWTAINAPAGAVIPQQERKAWLLERFGNFPFRLPAAIDATPRDAILQNDLVDRPPARVYTRERIVLLGDAAHPTTPNLGQGANMAIDDAIVLARQLRAEPALEAALRGYQRERLARTRLMVKRSWSYGRLARWKFPPAVKLREALLRHTPRRALVNILRAQILASVGPL